MNKERRQMKDSILNKQGPIQISSHILWIVQSTENVPKDNE